MYVNHLQKIGGGNFILLIIALIANVLLIADCVLLLFFHKVLDIDVIGIMLETHPAEIKEFTKTYLTPLNVILLVLVVIVFNISARKLAVVMSRGRRIVPTVAAILSGAGLILGVHTAVGYALYRNGNGMPQLSSLTRVAHAYMMTRRSAAGIEDLIHLADDMASTVKAGSGIDAAFVVVIGESHSVYRSSFMGYGKDTYPLIGRRIAEGEIAVCTDVVSAADLTHAVMHSIFSFGRSNGSFSSFPVFPMVFREAGYVTRMYDTQYLPGRGVSFLSDEELSVRMFDYRNTSSYPSDLALMDSVAIPQGRELIVCHIMGQHYDYAQRYPSDGFSFFTPGLYAGSPVEKRMQSDYDNACRYNDYVLDHLMERLSGSNVCLVYLSDHGEDVCETDGYIGHGNAPHRPDMRYQIRIPMFVWASRGFRESYPEKWEAVMASRHRPVISDDLPHILTDLSGIETSWFDPSRSFLNERFDSTAHRIVLNSVDYDAEWK